MHERRQVSKVVSSSVSHARTSFGQLIKVVSTGVSYARASSARVSGQNRKKVYFLKSPNSWTSEKNASGKELETLKKKTRLGLRAALDFHGE